MRWQERIEVNPSIFIGKPVVKGTRLTVEFVLNLFLEGYTEEQIMKDYPRLSREDIRACLAFALSRIQPGLIYPKAS